VVRAARRADVALAVNHSFREVPIFRALRDEIASGRHGELRFVQLWQLMDLAPADEPSAWRAAEPGSALLEAGIHLADLLPYLFGGAPEAVYARRGATDDAIVALIAEFPGGRLGQLTIDRLTTAATRYAEARVDCERADLRASWGGRALARVGKKRAERSGLTVEYGPGGLAWTERGLERRTLARNPRAPAVHGTARLLEGLARAVREGGEPPCSGAEALVTLELIDAAYRSAATGERVPLRGGRQEVAHPPGGEVPGEG
jgi:predicted dehydrogenase